MDEKLQYNREKSSFHNSESTQIFCFVSQIQAKLQCQAISLDLSLPAPLVHLRSICRQKRMTWSLVTPFPLPSFLPNLFMRAKRGYFKRRSGDSSFFTQEEKWMELARGSKIDSKQSSNTLLHSKTFHTFVMRFFYVVAQPAFGEFLRAQVTLYFLL